MGKVHWLIDGRGELHYFLATGDPLGKDPELGQGRDEPVPGMHRGRVGQAKALVQ